MSKNYIVYKVVTSPFSWTVKRRYSEFEWLRETLLAYFPGHFVGSRQVPPIPNKRAKGASKDDTVAKRQKFLQHFLTAVLQSPALASSEAFEGFLRLEDQKAFASFMKMISKARKPDHLPDMMSPSGALTCNAENDLEYIRKLNDYVCHSEVLRMHLRSQAISLSQSLESVSSCLNGLADTFKQLAQMQSRFSHLSSSMQVYDRVADTMSKWVSYEHMKATHVEEYLESFYSYYSNELGPIKELLREREALHANYLKAEARMNTRKEKLWNQGDVSKWEMSAADIGTDPTTLFANKEVALGKMLANETTNVRNLRNKFAFFNVQVTTETDRVLRLGGDKDLDNFIEMSKKEAEHCTTLHVAWTQLIARLTDLKFEKQAAFGRVVQV